MSHLDQKELDRLGAMLEQRRGVLRTELRELLHQSGDERYRELAGTVADLGEASVADLLSDIDIAIADRHVHELREIESARARLASGDFGICADCGGEIAYERLAAFPTAARCIVCQERVEKGYAHGGTPSL
jgi:DnaK suppressor protein